MQHIDIIIRANGNEGYDVGWRPMQGTTAVGPPIFLAKFEASAVGRREATMFKNGMVHGIRLAGNLIEGMVR